MPVMPTLFSAERTVAVFDPRPIVAEGISALLAASEDIDVVGATTEQETAIRLVVQDGVQVVLIGGAGRALDDVVDLAARLANAADLAGRRIGLVCVVPRGCAHLDTLRATHLPLVVTTGVSVAGLRDAIATACLVGDGAKAGTRSRSRVAAGSGGSDRSPTSLTLREREVLQNVAAGMSTREIALRMGITVNTVRSHVQHLLPKLGVHTRLQAAAHAAEFFAAHRSGGEATTPLGPS